MPWRSKVHRPFDVDKESRAKHRLVVSRSRRGYTRAWYAASREFLKKNPLCRECKEMDVIAPSQVTDHVIPHRGDMALFWDQGNWQPLCKIHHDVKTGRESA